MLAEAANGAAAEWDAEHHRGERVGLEPGMAGRDGPGGSSSTALDALGNSPQMDFPTVGSSPPAGWAEQDRTNVQQSPPQEQVPFFICAIQHYAGLSHDLMLGPSSFIACVILPCQSCRSLSSWGSAQSALHDVNPSGEITHAGSPSRAAAAARQQHNPWAAGAGPLGSQQPTLELQPASPSGSPYSLPTKGGHRHASLHGGAFYAARILSHATGW